MASGGSAGTLLTSLGVGSFATGSPVSGGTITSSGSGSVAMGYAFNEGGPASMSSTNIGSWAGGSALDTALGIINDNNIIKKGIFNDILFDIISKASFTVVKFIF